MNCFINWAGTLTVVAENETEEFALNSWAEYMNDLEVLEEMTIPYGSFSLESKVGSNQIIDDVFERKEERKDEPYLFFKSIKGFK